jgi:uncharacterized membrane protein YfhO
VLSEIYYPGWKVFIDGNEAEISSAYQVLRLVTLPEGSHSVQFVYRPLSVYAGLSLAGIGWLIALLLMIRKKF